MNALRDALFRSASPDDPEQAAVAASVINAYLMAVRTSAGRQHLTAADIPNILAMLDITGSLGGEPRGPRIAIRTPEPAVDHAAIEDLARAADPAGGQP